MLSYDQRKKLMKEWDWGDDHAQEKADFNKNMRGKLKRWLKEMPDMIVILQGLPPRVIENASLLDDLPKVIEFVDTFLEKADPLPVAEHESGEVRVFQNALQRMDEHPNLEGWENDGYIEAVGGKKYMIRSSSWTANPVEIHRSEILKNHAENVQRYVDPSVVTRTYSLTSNNEIRSKMTNRAEMMGKCEVGFQCVKPTEGIPTKPPCTPRVIIDDITED